MATAATAVRSRITTRRRSARTASPISAAVRRTTSRTTATAPARAQTRAPKTVTPSTRPAETTTAMRIPRRAAIARRPPPAYSAKANTAVDVRQSRRSTATAAVAAAMAVAPQIAVTHLPRSGAPVVTAFPRAHPTEIAVVAVPASMASAEPRMAVRAHVMIRLTALQTGASTVDQIAVSHTPAESTAIRTMASHRSVDAAHTMHITTASLTTPATTAKRRNLGLTKNMGRVQTHIPDGLTIRDMNFLVWGMMTVE